MKARILVGSALDRLKELPDGCVRTVVTSPPYWGLRDYGEDAQIGRENTPSEFVESLCRVFDEIWRVLADDGTIWINLGDSYAGGSQSIANTGRAGFGKDREVTVKRMGDGLKQKDLVGIPWRFAFAMQERGWYLRQDIIWSKPNPLPESVTDRCTKSHEYIFLMTKSPRYFYDSEAIREPLAESSVGRLKQDIESQAGSTRAHGDVGLVVKAMGDIDRGRNKRSVWSVPVARYKEAHFAVYPPALIEPCILAGSEPGDTVLDPFSGSGTTGEVALLNGRDYIGVELNPEYADLSDRRISGAVGMLGEVEVS